MEIDLTLAKRLHGTQLVEIDKMGTINLESIGRRISVESFKFGGIDEK